MKKTVLILALIFLAGCASREIGRKIDMAASQQIQIGKTTESEVLALLGAPLATKESADGIKVYGYRYIQASASIIPGTTKGSGDKLVIKFDKQRIVESIERGSVGLK
jgi:outer membrane protein assembly factor BamE (lipoprotein component of BamABCDE complex)